MLSVLAIAMPEKACIKKSVPEKDDWSNIINLTNEKGVLHGVGVAQALNGEQIIDIKIDRHCSRRGVICSGGSKACGNNGLTFNLPFEERLKLDVMSNDHTNQVRFWASFTVHE